MLGVDQTVVLLIVIILILFLIIPTSYRVRESIVGVTDGEPVKKPELFDDFWYKPYGLNMFYNELPFWNMQVGTTRNMSYDLRGDIPIPIGPVGPWLNSPRQAPIVNKPLWMVS